MGLVQKKDENDYVDGIEVIGRGEGPDDLDTVEVELHEGLTAEDISGTTAAREGVLETEADPELLDSVDDAEDADRDAGLDADCDEVEEQEDSAGDTLSSSAKGKNRTVLFAVLAVAAVIAAAIGGYFFGSGGFAKAGAPAALIAEADLDTPVASWTYKGATKDVTAREALESMYSLETVKTDDGLYPAPPADIVLTYVRNQILLADAEAQGIAVDDSELSATAEATLGMSDFAEIAKQFGVSEEQAKDIVRDQATIQKLYSTVSKDDDNNETWTTYVNNLFAGAQLELYGLYA